MKSLLLAVAIAASMFVNEAQAQIIIGSPQTQTNSQTQTGTVTGTNTSTNQNVNANTNTATNRNDIDVNNVNVNGNSAKSGSRSSAKAKSESNSGSDVSVVHNEAREVSSAAGFGLGVSNLTCAGTGGIGGQGASFGFSIGGSKELDDCVTVRAALTLYAIGHPKAAHARLCASAENRKAFEMVGDKACDGWDDKPVAANKSAIKTASGGVVHTRQ